MIKVDQLSKSYGDFLALDGITFTCQPGRVTGFLGPNGAGKTTTMRIMAGLTPASRGDITIGGYHFKDIPNRAATSGSSWTRPRSTAAGPGGRCSRSAPGPWA